MHDQVGIAANRRREVRVLVHGEAEVPEARRVVACLLHRPQHQRGDGPFLWRPTHPVDEPLKVTRANRLAGGGQPVPQRRDERFELLDLLDVRRLCTR